MQEIKMEEWLGKLLQDWKVVSSRPARANCKYGNYRQ
jgi:hypothetical protein